MELPRRKLGRTLACLLTVAATFVAANAAQAQGLFGCRSCAPCCGPANGCAGGGYGDLLGGAYGAAGGGYGAAGGAMGSGDQFPGSSLDLGESAPAQTGSMFAAADSGYIDDARVRTIARFRVDAAFNNIFPDRAEFFYAQCGCFGAGAPGPGVPGQATSGIDYQELWSYYEHSWSDSFSAFIDVPYRMVNFKFDPALTALGQTPIPNAGGFSDLQFGIKYALVAEPSRYDTFQLRVYTPTGDAGRGLGTNHLSLEPAYLAWRDLTDRMRFNGEFRVWIPFSNDNVNGQNFAGTVLRYGAGISYDIWQSCDCCDKRLALVNEIVGWSVLGGLKFNPFFNNGNPLSASGDTIVNYKIGSRYMWGNQSLYAGYGVALTRETWYNEIFRAEYTYRF